MTDKSNRRQIVIFLLILAGLFVLALLFIPRLPAPQGAALASPAPSPAQPSIAPPDPSCQDASAPFVAKIDPLVAQWESERQRTDQVQPDQLAAQVDKLRDLRQQAAGITPPSCAAALQQRLLTAMDLTIRAYQGFVNELPEDGIRSDLAAARQAFSDYTAVIAQLRKP